MKEKIKNIDPWFHNVEVKKGYFTREIIQMKGPHSIDNPASRWKALMPHIPNNMSNLNVFDIGSADFFSVEFAKRGRLC